MPNGTIDGQAGLADLRQPADAIDDGGIEGAPLRGVEPDQSGVHLRDQPPPSENPGSLSAARRCTHEHARGHDQRQRQCHLRTTSTVGRGNRRRRVGRPSADDFIAVASSGFESLSAGPRLNISC